MGPIKKERVKNERYSWTQKSFLPNSAVGIDTQEKHSIKEQRITLKVEKINWIKAGEKKVDGAVIKREGKKYTAWYRTKREAKTGKRKTNSASENIQFGDEIIVTKITLKIVDKLVILECNFG